MKNKKLIISLVIGFVIVIALVSIALVIIAKSTNNNSFVPNDYTLETKFEGGSVIKNDTKVNKKNVFDHIINIKFVLANCMPLSSSEFETTLQKAETYVKLQGGNVLLSNSKGEREIKFYSFAALKMSDGSYDSYFETENHNWQCYGIEDDPFYADIFNTVFTSAPANSFTIDELNLKIILKDNICSYEKIGSGMSAGATTEAENENYTVYRINCSKGDAVGNAKIQIFDKAPKTDGSIIGFNAIDFQSDASVQQATNDTTMINTAFKVNVWGQEIRANNSIKIGQITIYMPADSLYQDETVFKYNGKFVSFGYELTSPENNETQNSDSDEVSRALISIFENMQKI